VRRARELTEGFSDGLGDRLLTFDRESGSSLELLRFKPEFGTLPTFEMALRARVTELSHLHHPSLGTVRGVDTLEDSNDLILVSTHTAGRRLSELVPRTSGPVFALEFIRHIVPVLSGLQQCGPGVVHGVLTLDRVVGTRDGRLVLVEHVLGSAIQSLHLPTAVLRTKLGLALPSGSDTVELDARTDIIQLGFVALQLLMGRRIDPADYPSRIGAVLDESANAEGGASWSASRLRSWIERALQVTSRSIGSAAEAFDSLGELPTEAQFQSSGPRRLVAVSTSALTNAESSSEKSPASTAQTPAATPKSDEARATRDDVPARTATSAATPVTKATSAPPAPTPATPAAPAKTKTARRKVAPVVWIAGGLATLALIEGGFLLRMRTDRSQQFVIEVPPTKADTTEARVEPTPAATEPASKPIAPSQGSVASPAPLTPQAPSAAAATSAVADASAGDRGRASGHFGGVTLTAPVELQVFEGGKAVGSTVGPIAVAEGTHTFDLVNDSLGYRSRQAVTVKPGQMISMSIAMPNGHVSINAQPWADVIIDGTAAGQTPLANVSLPIGPHEIIFRHPQFPEQRQTTVVRADGVTRVSVNMQR
jgi:hypothetical protein